MEVFPSQNISQPSEDVPVASSLEIGLDYLKKVIELRLTNYFSSEQTTSSISEIPFPAYTTEDPLGNFVQLNQLDFFEHLLLLMALAPHLQADFYDSVIRPFIPEAGDFPQFGGLRGKQFRGMLPSGETALFVLGGADLLFRLDLHKLFDANHPFAKQRILYLDSPPADEPRMCGKLVLNEDYVELFTQGRFSSPQFSVQFPAQKIETQMEWDDLVLHPHTQKQIKELEAWINHADILLNEWGLSKKIKQGYRALFYGPPGTGKTLTASLLGKYTKREVYKIDLSMVLSKYIGETEKNLSKLFAKAENKGWILFFDEADAIFGKRTSVRDAHDKYANQEVSYLLQRVENYNGLVILASNFKSNIDEAFIRRFQSIIYFPMPQPGDRLALWQKGFPDKIQLDSAIDLKQIAQQYELTGSNIMNIVFYCCLGAANRNSTTVSKEDLLEGIQREFRKEGKAS